MVDNSRTSKLRKIRKHSQIESYFYYYFISLHKIRYLPNTLYCVCVYSLVGGNVSKCVFEYVCAYECMYASLNLGHS